MQSSLFVEAENPRANGDVFLRQVKTYAQTIDNINVYIREISDMFGITHRDTLDSTYYGKTYYCICLGTDRTIYAIFPNINGTYCMDEVILEEMKKTFNIPFENIDILYHQCEFDDEMDPEKIKASKELITPSISSFLQSIEPELRLYENMDGFYKTLYFSYDYNFWKKKPIEKWWEYFLEHDYRRVSKGILVTK